MRTYVFAMVAVISFVSDSDASRRRARQTSYVEPYAPISVPGESGPSVDALDEVNAARARRGLPPYLRDEGLSRGAAVCAQFRASRLMTGHTANDFNALEPGVSAAVGGCAAWEPEWGWGSCATYDNYRYAGAAWSMGRDGRRYMHLFCR